MYADIRNGHLVDGDCQHSSSKRAAVPTIITTDKESDVASEKCGREDKRIDDCGNFNVPVDVHHGGKRKKNHQGHKIKNEIRNDHNQPLISTESLWYNIKSVIAN